MVTDTTTTPGEKPTPICTDMLNEARRDIADVVEELGALCTHLREAAEFAESGHPSVGAACIEDAHEAIGAAMMRLREIRDKSGRWAVWADGAAKAQKGGEA